MSGLEAALAEVAGRLEERGLPYMVIGGMANLQWGEPRTTQDLDITVAVEDSDLIQAAGELGSILVDHAPEFLARTRVLPIALREGTRVDLIVATLPYEIEAIRRARPVPIGDRTISVCSPEDLVLHKILSERPKDLTDVVGILRRQGDAIDFGFLDPLVDDLSRELSRPEIADRYREAKSTAGSPKA